MATTAGIDTIRLAFRDPEIAERLGALREITCPFTDARLPSRPVDRGWGWTIKHVGATVVGYPDHIVVEARMAALLENNVNADYLSPPSRVADAVRAARRLVEVTAGAAPQGAVGIARCDLAAELWFIDPTQGREWMAAAACLALKRLKRQVIFAEPHLGGSVESVLWSRASGGTVLRLYDAGARHATHERGARLRLEREHRAHRQQQRTPSQFLDQDLGDLFLSDAVVRMCSGQSIAVAGSDSAAAVIALSDFSPVVAMRMYGAVYLVERDLDDDGSATKRLRDAGLIIDRHPTRHTIVDLRPGLLALRAAWDRPAADGMAVARP